MRIYEAVSRVDLIDLLQDAGLTCRLSSDQIILGRWSLPDWSSSSVV